MGGGLWNGPPRGGARGGKDQFSWEAVKTDKDREYYLGHSVKVTSGQRWQKGRDIYWYNKEKQSSDVLEDEVKAVKAREEELMMEALGLKPKSASTDPMDAQQLDAAIKGKRDEAGGEAPDRAQGLGFAHEAAAQQGVTHSTLPGEGAPQPPQRAQQHAAPANAGGMPLAALQGLSAEQVQKLLKKEKKAAKKKEKHKKKSKQKKQKKHKRSSGAGSDSDSSGSSDRSRSRSRGREQAGGKKHSRSRSRSRSFERGGARKYPNLHEAPKARQQQGDLARQAGRYDSHAHAHAHARDDRRTSSPPRRHASPVRHKGDSPGRQRGYPTSREHVEHSEREAGHMRGRNRDWDRGQLQDRVRERDRDAGGRGREQEGDRERDRGGREMERDRGKEHDRSGRQEGREGGREQDTRGGS